MVSDYEHCFAQHEYRRMRVRMTTLGRQRMMSCGRDCYQPQRRKKRRLAMFFLVVLMLVSGVLEADATVFEFDDVASLAKKLSEAPFQEPKQEVPDWLMKISYDQWRDIRFKPSDALWRDRRLRFEVQFFHPGFLYNRIVQINTIDAAGVHPVAFSPDQFDYGKNTFANEVPQTLGYAGFRVHYPINRRDHADEFLVFLGASYFRAVGANEVYGISARGLAIDTGLPSGEEFPFFKAFWLVRPTQNARSIRIYALLDSKSCTGAYSFDAMPGEQTVMNVSARIFLRNKIERLGIAPLTSMFYFGENTLQKPIDYRPEVHDSDGLLLAMKTGEWIWRPLSDPKRLNISDFQAAGIKGFGVLQRDRNFDHYQDFGTREDLRPSVWIVPHGDWGDGSVQLVEIPSNSEQNDNVASFWHFTKPAEPGPQPISFAYDLFWHGGNERQTPGGYVVATRQDYGTHENAHRFVIDFTGKDLEKLPADTVLQGVTTIGSGSGQDGDLLEQQVIKDPVTAGWRLVFQFRAAKKEPIDLRSFLKKGDRVLTETWTSVVLP
jgi:periplasmic glucans biosynthesis protein